MLLEGLFIPLTTPFYQDGRLNLLKLEHNAGHYSKTPAAGLAVLSKWGEPTLLSDNETRQALKAAVDAAAATKVMLAGVARDSVVGTLDLADYAASVGYDAALVKRPSVLKGGRQRTKELVTYFQAVADRSALPVVLYDSEAQGASPLSLEVVAELSGHPQIIGLLDSEGSRVRIETLKLKTAAVKRDVAVTAVFAAVTGRMLAQAGLVTGAGTLISADTLTDGGAALAVAPPKPSLKTRTKVVGFQIVAGNTAGMLDSLLSGAVGAMPGFAASAPQACYEVLAAWKDGDEGLAQEKQIRIREAADRIEGELGIPGLKFGCDLNGYFGGWPRMPFLMLTGEERSAIERLMQGLRN